MADVVKKETSKKKIIVKWIIRAAIVCSLCSLAFFLVSPNYTGYVIACFIWGVLFLLLAVMTIRFNGEFAVVRKGFIGEQDVNDYLCKLPEGYIVINDVVIPNGENHTAQIDHIVIGENGIFCIETKNWKGEIHGNDEVREWQQFKRSSRGRVFAKSYYSPVKQCTNHAMALKNIINTLGIRVYVQPVVVFTDSSVRLRVTSSVPVLKLNELLHFITTYSSWRRFPEEERARIRAVIMDHLINV